jgi:hypothetical protein
VHAHTRGWLLALALAAPLTLVAGPSSADPLVLDRVVAVVDDEIVLESDLDLWLIFDDNIRLELGRIENPTEQQIIAKLTEMRPGALDELIGRMLLLRQAATFQIKATDAVRPLTSWSSRTRPRVRVSAVSGVRTGEPPTRLRSCVLSSGTPPS